MNHRGGAARDDRDQALPRRHVSEIADEPRVVGVSHANDADSRFPGLGHGEARGLPAHVSAEASVAVDQTSRRTVPDGPDPGVGVHDALLDALNQAGETDEAMRGIPPQVGLDHLLGRRIGGVGPNTRCPEAFGQEAEFFIAREKQGSVPLCSGQSRRC